jgi:protein TonB
MPADLFRSDLPSTPVRRRASLLPVSIAVHVTALAAAIIVPLFADAEFPAPAHPAGLAYVEVTLPPPPPPPRPQPAVAPTTQSTSPDKAPIDAPPAIVPEREMTVTQGMPFGELSMNPGGEDAGQVPAIAPPPAPPPPQPKTVRPGGSIRVPRRINDVRPVYPVIAQQARREGTVVIDALIGEDGRIRQARVLSKPEPLLDEAALAAVRQWVFTPTLLNGEPVSVAMTVTVDFRLH